MSEVLALARPLQHPLLVLSRLALSTLALTWFQERSAGQAASAPAVR